MATYYINSDSDLSGLVTSANDMVLFKSGVTFSAGAIPASLLTPSGIVVGYFGSGDKPVISGGVERSDWTYDAVNNVYTRPAYGSNVLGNVTEDGIPMKHVPWTTDLATTAALMNSGSNGKVWAGSMTFNTATNTLYIRPSVGTAAEHKYIVSEVTYGFRNTSTSADHSISDIKIERVSFHGINLLNKTRTKMNNLEFAIIGGGRPGGNYLGNGIEVSVGCWGTETTNCIFSDIFDSPVTSQLYESSPARIGSHLWQNLTMERYGMHGVEISCQTQAHQYITDIEINKIRSTNQGVSFGGDRNGAVITALTQGGTSRVNRVFATDVTGNVQRRLYMSIRSGGLNGIQDAVGTGSYGEGVRSDQLTGLYAQVDLKRNVTDNLAPVSSLSTWKDVTVDLRKNFGYIL